MHDQIDPKIGLEGENINICVFKEGILKILIFGKMAAIFNSLFYEKWQKWLKIGFNMVTILPKMKIFKIPSLKTQILIISTSKPNLVSIWPANGPKNAQECKNSLDIFYKWVYFATSSNTYPYVSIRKISTTQAREVTEHILETRNIGEQHISKQKKKYFFTTDPPPIALTIRNLV